MLACQNKGALLITKSINELINNKLMQAVRGAADMLY